MAGERGARLSHLLDQRTALGFERDSLRLEPGPCPGGQERMVGGPFAPRANRHIGFPKHFGMPRETPECSAPIKIRGNRLKIIPPLQAAMSFYCTFDQNIHYRVPREVRFNHEKIRATIGSFIDEPVAPVVCYVHFARISWIA
jgi:hypothetical protein